MKGTSGKASESTLISVTESSAASGCLPVACQVQFCQLTPDLRTLPYHLGLARYSHLRRVSQRWCIFIIMLMISVLADGFLGIYICSISNLLSDADLGTAN